MKVPQAISSEGFSIDKIHVHNLNLALFSLKIALKAFFSTYSAMKYELHLFDGRKNRDQNTIDLNHTPDYWEAYAESIVHFQHFVELVIKDLLRNEHPLLPLDARNDSVILHKMLKGESLDDLEYQKIKTVEFSEAFRLFKDLVQRRGLGNGNYSFFLQYSDSLESVNSLRNRIWHKGTYILRYPSLDELFGQRLIPFIQEVVKLDDYAEREIRWKYQTLHCGVDPMIEITKEMRSGRYDLGKVAMLKELARAAYENPLDNSGIKFLRLESKKRAESAALAIKSMGGVHHIEECPVCGLKSLLVYAETELDDENEERGTSSHAFRYTWQAKCLGCSFEINHELKNPSEYGLPIADYWTYEEF